MTDKLVKSPFTVNDLIRDEKGRFIKGIKYRLGKTHSNPLKGKKMSEEWRVKLKKPKSIKHIKSPEHLAKLGAKAKLRIGPLNNRWKGGKRAIHSALRKQRINMNGGFHSLGEWETLKARCNWTCVNPECRKQEPEIKLTRDHIISIKDGGSDNIENIQPLCAKCNNKKFSKSIKYG